MNNQDFIKDYPGLVALTVGIRADTGCLYVFAAELEAKLGPEKTTVFRELFGVQTRPYFEGRGAALYPWDVEAVLERMESGKRTGTQLIWD